MKPPKPRVTATTDATTASLTWEPVAAASYYVITLNGVSSSSVEPAYMLYSLAPGSSYAVTVVAVSATSDSHPAFVHFETDELVIDDDLGSGDTLFPAGTALGERQLLRSANGYSFDNTKSGVLVQGRSRQFGTFRLGAVDSVSRLKIALQTTGDWESDAPVLFVKVDGATGWLDARKRRVPGVRDVLDGARALVSLEDNIVTVTFNGVVVSGQGFLRVGFSQNGFNQTFASARIV